jgi:hypothetical protein
VNIASCFIIATGTVKTLRICGLFDSLAHFDSRVAIAAYGCVILPRRCLDYSFIPYLFLI